MHKCTHNAAGGTIHRLNSGPAMFLCRLNSPAAAVVVLIAGSFPLLSCHGLTRPKRLRAPPPFDAQARNDPREIEEANRRGRNGDAIVIAQRILVDEKTRAIWLPWAARPSIERRTEEQLSRPLIDGPYRHQRRWPGLIQIGQEKATQFPHGNWVKVRSGLTWANKWPLNRRFYWGHDDRAHQTNMGCSGKL